MLASLPSSTIDRVWALILALLLGQFFIFDPIHEVWHDHWLVKDGQEGTAVITKEHWAGHGVVVYEYRVGEKLYTGQAFRDLQKPRYTHVIPGEKTIIYFSSSHPWLSAINLPHSVGIQGLPVVLLAWFFEILLIVTVIDPRNRWALNFRGRQRIQFGQVASAQKEAPTNQFDDRKQFKEILWLVGCAIMIVLGMAALEIAINSLFGRK